MKRAWALVGLMVSASPLAVAAPLAKGDSARGQGIVTRVCAACHGADGNSAIPLNPKLAGQTPEYIQKKLANFMAAPVK